MEPRSSSRPRSVSSKSLFVAYLLWLFGGFFGLHHFYLRRNVQGVLWLSSYGMFGFGWFRDAFRMPDYVEDANEEQIYMELLVSEMSKRPAPKFSFGRFVAQVFFASYYRYFVVRATTEIVGVYPAFLLGAVAAAGGIWMVGNVGRQTGEWKKTVLGMIVGSLLSLLILGVHELSTYSTIVGAITFSYYRTWNRQPAWSTGGLCRRGLTVVGIMVLFSSLVLLSVYNNAEITLQDGERIMLKDHLQNLWDSPAWRAGRENLWRLWEQIQRDGWKPTWDKFKIQLDLEGENRGYETLGLKEGASWAEIKKAHRRLAMEWHPDKNPDRQEEAQKKFIEIQKAYEALEKIYKRRGKTAAGTDDEDSTHPSPPKPPPSHQHHHQQQQQQPRPPHQPPKASAGRPPAGKR